MSIQSFRDIIVWQKAHALCLMIYKLSAKFPKEEEFGLKSQLRRNGVSVASNFVEGFKRKSKNDAIHFYIIAESSLEEMKYQLILAKDLEYLSVPDFETAYNLAEEVGKLLHKWKSNQQ